MKQVGKTAGLLALTISLAAGMALMGAGCSAQLQAGQDAATGKIDNTAEPMTMESTNEAVASGAPTYDAAYMGYSEDVGYFDTEEYSATNEQGFISTSTRPLSTFSSDVDTASYCNLRRMVGDGYALDDIPQGAVRVEEMLNYFNYDYANPAPGQLFGVTTHLGTCPWNPQTELLTIGFATAPDASAAKAGCNLVFLIDTSGSMDSYDKLPLLQESFGVLVEQLDASDRVSIVTYSGEERVVLQGAAGNDKQAILGAIGSLQAYGSTNGESGLRRAYQIARENYIEGGVNRIVMASDGDLNVGMTSESELKEFVEQQRDSGIYLSVLGFGTGNYKDNKMETLADYGNGNYHYIDCLDEAQRVFSQNLMQNIVPLADDVKLQVEFNPAQVKGYRLIGYENRAMADEDFADDQKDAGDVGAGAQFTVAYEIVRADSAFDVPTTELKYGNVGSGIQPAQQPQGDEWLTCSIRYKTVGQSESRLQQHVVKGSDWQDNPGDDWRFAAAVIELGMLASGSDYAGTSSLQSVAALLQNVPTALTDADRNGFVQLVKQLEDNDRWQRFGGYDDAEYGDGGYGDVVVVN